MANKNKLLLIDGNSVAFRAFFALHNSMERFKNKNGLHTNAIYAFHNMLKITMEKEKPTHVLIAFDAGKTTFRHAYFEDYKAGRAKTPGEFREQLPYIREMIEAMGIQHYELENYEADDIIGTLATHVDPKEFDVVVVSGDRDLTQLATEDIRVDVNKKGVTEIESYTPEHIKEKYGLTPTQIIDMKGLAGDASDNIPGVTKIGEKTAIKLLKDYGTVEGVYEHLDDLKPSKMKENLINDKEQALLSKKLATINTDAPIEVKVTDLVYQGADIEKLVAFYKEMDFKSFLAKLDTSDLGEDQTFAAIKYEVVKKVTKEMFTDEMAIYIEMLDENYHTAEIVGIAWGNQEKIYIAEPMDVLEEALFKDWLRNEKLIKWTFDAKRTRVALHRYTIDLKNIQFDVLLASYLLDTNDNSNDLGEVAAEHDYHELAIDEMVYGKGAKKGLPEDVEEFYGHLARKIKAINVLTKQLSTELEKNQQQDLFFDMELPLSQVLAEMEMTGIKVEPATLREMQGDFSKRLAEIEEKIYAEAGEKFNINSPKQLSVILFEKMGLPVIKKTKTGYSTAVDVLEQLRAQAPIVDDILTYRQIAKIQSTYVEGLLKVIHSDGKIHTRYVQTLTQTGRLSSVDPNLQNIPIRLEEGRKIRQAFVPSEPDWQLFSADYSQIELRVLAHISDDEHLKAAFNEGQDIHASTAMRVFGIENADDVTPNMRRQAKAVNFGIVYGISDYGLSQNLGISRKEAQQFIDTYFEKYPGVKKYMTEIVREAKEKGYVETLFHRRRYLPDINARNFNMRSFAERTAMNTPIQGSAADIIKMAMIEMQKRLATEKLETRMLLQVHDELIFEAPKKEIEILNKIVPDVMENTVKLHVPIKVDSSYGDTWYDAK